MPQKLTIEQKKKILEKWEEPQPSGKKLSSRTLADYFSAKWERPLSKTAVQNILNQKDRFVNLPKKAGFGYKPTHYIK